MVWLLAGLVLFLGMHSLRIVADPWRTAQIERLGAKPWRGLFSLVVALGLALIVVGYGQARLTPQVLWASPAGMRHLAALLTLPAFILLVASKVPGNALKRRLRHPMLAGTGLWALAHLLANNTLADLLLFGGFMLWALLCWREAAARDRAATTPAEAQVAGRTAWTVLIGVSSWAAFAFWAHALLIGIAPWGARAV